ncbi:MAG: UDP-N-acetylmuramoyl-L-alanine--D-glutamate ligase [Myxococcota bacterium]
MDIRGKKIFILGAARTGMAAALLSKQKGAIPFISDIKQESELVENFKWLRENNIEFESGKNSFDRIKDFDILIISPGIHLSDERINEIKSYNVPILSEIEFAFRFIDVPIIAITGTNGKSTTTALIGYILNNSGRSAFVGGNIGNPLSNMVTDGKYYDCAVVEVSSFMLENIESFKPNMVVFTNISPDHLDKYKNYEEYIKAKLNIFKNLDEMDAVILNMDCEDLIRITGDFNFKKYFFSKSQNKGASAYSIKKEDRYEIVLKRDFDERRIIYKNKNLLGEHNLENVLAASLASAEFGVEIDDIQNGVNSFMGLEHRIEFVREINGIRFFNDSKATNIDSTMVALKSFDRGIVWIAGGRHKGTPYTILKEIVRARVKKIIAIGEAADIIESDLKDVVDIENLATDFEGAVKRAFESAEGGDVVLLSPACSSYDMFKNYEERGKVFKDIVRGLKI